MSPTSSMVRGKPLFLHMRRITMYPKNEIIVGRPYLFGGEHGQPGSLYGFLHDIIAECRIISEDLDVIDMYFRVKKLEQVSFKEYETRDQQEEELKTPSRSPHHSSQYNEEQFDEAGNLIVVLKNKECMADLSFKEIIEAQDTVKALSVHHSLQALEKYVRKKQAEKVFQVEQTCILLGPSKRDIQLAVEDAVERIITKLEMDAGRQTVKKAIANESLDLIEFAAKIWAEGGFRTRQKKKAARLEAKGMEVEGMTIKEIELEFQESEDDQESKEDTWSRGSVSMNEAELEDELPVQKFRYEPQKIEKKKDREYKEMFHLKEKEKMIRLGQEEEDQDEGMLHSQVSSKKSQRSPLKQKLSQKKRKEIVSDIEEKYNKGISVSMLNFVPAEMSCRDLETVQIKNFLEGSLKQNVKGSLYISGMPGTGKTALVLRSINQFKKNYNFKFIQINAMNLSKPVMLYKILYEQIMVKGKSVKGEDASARLESYFRNHPLINKSGQHIFLLLDELDAIVNKKQDVLYNLFNWPTYDDSGFSVIAIANTMDLPEQFQPKIASRIGKLRVVFEPYSKEQMMKILESRVARFQLFEKDALRFLATRVAQQSGDFRRVLHTARQSLEMSRIQYRQRIEQGQEDVTEPQKVKVKTVLEAYNFLYGVKLHRSLKEISPVQKVILVALLWSSREKNRSETNKGIIRYAQDSSHKIDLYELLRQIGSVVNEVMTRKKTLVPEEEVCLKLISIWYEKKDLGVDVERELTKNMETLTQIEAKRVIQNMGFLFNNELVDSVLLNKVSVIKQLQQMEKRRFVKITESPKFYDVELQVFKSELLTAMQRDPIFNLFGDKIGAEEL